MVGWECPTKPREASGLDPEVVHVSQTLSFLQPADIGERLTAVCEISEHVRGDKYQLTTDVVDADGERLVEGQAAVLIDEPPDIGRVEVEAIPAG